MDPEQLTEKLVSWIKETVPGNRPGLVFGMSGGLDSSVLAVLCKRARPEAVLGLIMPCYSIAEDEAHALAVAGKFAIPTRMVVLDRVYDSLFNTLTGEGGPHPANRLAQANLKVRLRMITLYYLANQFSYLVAGSSNRSELAMGYFTKYGDGAADLLPLGNLVKKQVRDLARFLDIPGAIIEKPPSAGLWPGQTDEGELGFSYNELDGYLLTGEAPAGLKSRIEARIAASAHKRRLPPVPGF